MGLRLFLRSFLLKRGVALSHPPGQFNVVDWKLEQLHRRGFDPKIIVDGGAAQGGWSDCVAAAFPNAKIVMIEPRDDVRAVLQERADKRGDFLVPKLIGAQVGEIEFFESGAQSSVLPMADGSEFGTRKRVAITTLDAIFDELPLPPPDLIKLDLQGIELDALRGASRILPQTAAVLLEVSLFPFQKSCPLAAEVIAFMNERGFVLYDIFALWARPLDGALAQGDFLFVRHDHPLRSDGRWDTTSAVTA